jgi:hypothetical protein
MTSKTKNDKCLMESEGITVDERQLEEDIFAPIAELLKGRPKPRPMTRGRVQLERAPNAAVFIEHPQYLAGPQLHYPQFEVVRDFFELLCPICNDVERIRTRNDIPREDQILFEYDICPKCSINRNSIRDEFCYYNEMIGVVGMRGGKSVLVACMSAYMLHEILCVDSIQDKLGLVRSQEIDGAFVAVSMEQAAETIYGHFRGFYEDSPWFQGYKKALLDLEIADPGLHRGDLYWETERYIYFKEKRIRIKSLTSNSGSIAGKTRIFAVIDELSRMDAGESKRSANEVYRVLKRSLLTIKASVDTMRQKGDYTLPDARMFCISSPMYEDDKSMQLLKQAGTSKKMFAFHRTTWDFNPEISKELLSEEFAHDAIGAERDYGANPPGAINPFIRNPDIVEICIDEKRGNSLTIRETNFDEKVKGIMFYYIKMILENIQYRNLYDYAIHADPGQKQDSFCVAIGHLDHGTVYIDGAVEARPIPKNNKQGLTPREVHFPSITDIITGLVGKISLRMLSYDRWNSTEQIHTLRAAGILSFQKNIIREDYTNFLNAMIAGKIKFPKRENEYADPTTYRMMPCSKALHELKRLNDDGVYVDHPDGGSSDMIQCYVGVHRLLAHPENVINMQELNKINKAQGLKHSLNRRMGRIIRLPAKGSRR